MPRISGVALYQAVQENRRHILREDSASVRAARRSSRHGARSSALVESQGQQPRSPAISGRAEGILIAVMLGIAAGVYAARLAGWLA